MKGESSSSEPSKPGSIAPKSKRGRKKPDSALHDKTEEGESKEAQLPPPPELISVDSKSEDAVDQNHQADHGSNSAPPTTSPTPLRLESELENADPTLFPVVEGGWSRIDVPKFVQNKYEQDLFFKDILANPKAYRNFEVQDGRVYMHLEETKVVSIPHLEFKGHNLREIVISEAHSVLAHLGPKKTVDYPRHVAVLFFFSPSLVRLSWPQTCTAGAEICPFCGPTLGRPPGTLQY
jgi:hypothetical protein